MAKQTGGGNRGALLLVLLLLLGGVGWNYHRNLEAEKREPRPYRGYADADLTALADAFEHESKTAGRRYDAAVSKRASAHEKGDFMGNVNEFERVQRAGNRTRDARADYAGARASLEALREEQSRRAADRSGLRVFLRRAFTF
jgi:hypothetical protein